MVTTNPYLPLPLLPELIARPRRDDDGNFDHVRLHHDVKWGRKSRPIPCRFGGASLSDENGWRESEFRGGGDPLKSASQWVAREKVGVKDPFAMAAGRSSFPATTLPTPLLVARERRERDSSQLLFSSRISHSSLQAGTVTSRAMAASDLEGDRSIFFLQNWRGDR